MKKKTPSAKQMVMELLGSFPDCQSSDSEDEFIQLLLSRAPQSNDDAFKFFSEKLANAIFEAVTLASILRSFIEAPKKRKIKKKAKKK